jgi:Ca2+-binding EF-hand superfamily protein
MGHVRNILWNFGMWRISKREVDALLAQNDIDPRKSVLDWEEVLMLVSQRMYQMGYESKAREMFKVIDQKEKGVVTPSDLKIALQTNLSIPVSEKEINEFFNMAGAEEAMTYSQFLSLAKTL